MAATSNNSATIDQALQNELLKAGVQREISEVLSTHFAGTDPAAFVGGLRTIGYLLANEDPGALLRPTAEPWQTIFQIITTDIQLNNCDPIESFCQAVTPYEHDRDLQQAITESAAQMMQHAQKSQQAQQTAKMKKVGRPKTLRPDEYSKALADLGYKVRLNLCTDQIEVNGKPISDGLRAFILKRMANRDFWNMGFIDTVLLADAYENAYHPVKDYLESLPAYDGGKYIEQLASHFTNPDGLFYTWLRKWMIGAIAKVYQKGQNPMLILDGPQNIGKSLFVRWLCSGIPSFFCEGNIDTNDKDAYLRLASKWIWEVGEVGATMRKSDREALKNFLTLGEVTVRRSYGKYDTVKPAMASFMGTVNNEGGILDDPTGNRRFLICHLESIDWQSYTQMDINKVWGEAYAAYLAGEPWTLTPSERKLSEQNNEQYQVEDPIELVLNKKYHIDPREKGWWVSTIDITTTLQDAKVHFASSRALQMAIAATLKRLGLTGSRRLIGNQRESGYQGIKSIP